MSDKPIKISTEKPTPQTDPWGWMRSWLIAYDNANSSKCGEKIYEWIEQQPTN